MKFRSATQADSAQICALERLPEFRTMVGSWPEDQHVRMLADPDAVYIVAEDQTGRIAGFAILQGLLSEHKQVELKRLVVRTPNQGFGKQLLTEVADRAFGEHSAHRLFLDVFATNDRARHVYENFGFRKEGIMRDAIYRDGAYHSLVLMSLLETEYRSGGKAPANETWKQGGTNG
jgi:diamine N-acetyltransferase